jgi:hypothetical protein
MATREGHDNFMLMRYEGLQANQQCELAQVAHLMGVNPDSERINQAIERSSAASMRNMEKTQGNGAPDCGAPGKQE